MAEQVVSKRRPVRRIVRRLPLIGWLTLVWVLLWGTIDVGTVFFGLLVGVLVSIVFPVPPIDTNIVLHPWSLLRLAAYLAYDLVSSTLRVSWQAVRYGPNTTASIIAVRTLTDSDHLTAMAANALSMAPGRFVMQIDRANRICYIYALATSDAEAVRREFHALERRIVRAVGARSDLVRCAVPEEAVPGGNPGKPAKDSASEGGKQ